MATCGIKGCQLEAADKDIYCEGHNVELDRRASPLDVRKAVELVKKMPWTVLWSVKRILDGHHPGGDDDIWLADTQKFNDTGRLELRGDRFHYKVDENELFSRKT
jgi:hypothetical protein